MIGFTKVADQLPERFEALHDFYCVFQDVSKILPQFAVDQRQIFFVQSIDQIPLRQEHFTCIQHFTPQSDNLVELRLFCIHQDFFLQLFDQVLDFLHDLKKTLYNLIHQMIKKGIRPVDLFFSDNLQHPRVKAGVVLCNGDDIVTAEKQIDLAQKNILVPKFHTVDHDEVMVLVHFQLRALLLLVDAVLDRQVVQAKEVLQHIEVKQRGIDPIKAVSRRELGLFNIVNQGDHSVLDETNLHTPYSCQELMYRCLRQTGLFVLPVCSHAEIRGGSENHRPSAEPTRSGSDGLGAPG